MRWKRYIPWVLLVVLAGSMGSALGPDFVAAARSHFWSRVPCRILRSSVEEEAFSRSVTHFVLRVEFEYELAGRPYRSHRFTSGSRQGSTDVSRAERAAIRFPAGAVATCLVNPANPSEAVLEPGELWGGLFLMGPFVIFGLMQHEGILGWLENRRQRREHRSEVPLSECNEAIRMDPRHLVFGSLGIVLGTLFTVFCVFVPIWKWRRAQSWESVPCTLLRSEVTSHAGQHGPEYERVLVYEYRHRGRVLRSGEFGLAPGIGVPVADMAEWSEQHPAGSEMTAYVNPDESTEAILNRSLQLDWITVVLGIGFLTSSVLMLWRARRGRRERGHVEGEALYRLIVGTSRSDSREYRSGVGRRTGGALFLALSVPAAWAGTWSLAKAGKALFLGEGDIMNSLYGAAAMLLTGWLIQKVWRNLRRATAGDVIIRVTPGSLTVGRPFVVTWSLDRPARSESHFRCCLEGREEVLLRQVSPGLHGAVSEEKPVRHMFQSVPLGDASGGDAREGTFRGQVPAGTMHSLRGLKASVIWELKIEFAAGGGRRVHESFPIDVLPLHE